MTGREEIDLKNEEWIKKKLNNQTQILSDYMTSIEDKTSWSRRNYLGYLIQFINFLKENSFDITNNNVYKTIKPLDINKYLKYISYRYVNGNKIENKAGIKAAKLFAVSDFFSFLVDNDIVEKNPCEKIPTPKDKEEKEIISMTADEVKTIEENILNRGKGRGKKYNTRDLCIVMLGVSTGLRVSAIVEINVSDIDFKNNLIMITEKGNIRRPIMIGEKTKNVINKWVDERSKLIGDNDTDALFISKNKQRISTVSVRKMLAKETYNIDKHITPHKMRSTCATNLYDATGDIYLVQEQLGHANIANTRRYAKVSTERKMMATKALDNLI